MKFKSLILTAFASVAALLSSCTQTDELIAPKMATDSATYSIGADGGDVTVKLLAGQDWTATVEPGTSLDEVSDVTVTPDHGVASSALVEVKVNMGVNEGFNRKARVSFHGATLSAAVIIEQEGKEGERLLTCTVSEFLKKPVDASVYYQITGLVGTIANDVYSNFYIVDPKTAESILIYGLAYKADITNQKVSVLKTEGVQEGDMITIASTRGAYGDTPEGMNSYYISHEKSQSPMIKLGLNEVTAVVGQSFELPVTSNMVTWTLSSDVEWLSFEPASGSESTTVVVSVSDAGEGDNATITLSAEGLESQTCAVTRTNIQDATAAEVNEAEDGKVFRLTGLVSSVANETYGNLYIKDYTGEVYVYGTNNFADYGIVAGDVITVVGSKTSYKESPQMKNVDVEKHYSIKDITVSDFRAAEDNNEVYYRLTGKVTKSTEDGTKFDLDAYGNFALEDETGNVYVYGVLPGWGSPKGQFGPLGVKEGDTITIIAYKTTYKELIEAAGGVYISHVAGEEPEPGPEPEPETALKNCGEINAAILAGETALTIKLENPAEITLMGSDKKSIYVQDETGAVLVYNADLYTMLSGAGAVAGAAVQGEFTATATVYNGLPEITAAEVGASNITATNKFPCLSLTIAELLADFDKYLNCKVKISDVAVNDGWSGSDKNGVIAQGETTIPLYVKTYNSSITVEVPTGAKGNFTGFVAYNNTTKQLTFWEDSGFEAIGGEEPEPEVGLKNCGEINAAILAGETALTIKLENPAEITLMGSDSKSIFVQDETGAVLVYNADLYTMLSGAGAVAGAAVQGEFTATATVYNGLPEITAAEVGASNITATNKFPCLSLTIAELLADFDKYLNCKVKISDVAVNDGWSGSDKNGVIAQGETTIPLYVKTYNSSITVEVPTGAKGNFTGFVAYNNTTKQLTFWEDSGFEATEITGIITVKSSLNLEEGATANLAATVNSGAALSYASSDETVATVSAEGVVTAVKEGTATITVSAPAQGIYTAASAEVAVTVTAAQAGGDVTVLYEDKFDWLAPFIAQYAELNSGKKIGDTVGEANKSANAPNVYTTAPFNTEEFAAAFAEKGYVDLNPSDKLVYAQDQYLKFSKTKGFNTGIELNLGKYVEGTQSVDLSFDYAMMLQGSDTVDEGPVTVLIIGDGTFADGSKRADFVSAQQTGEFFWNKAEAKMLGITPNTKIQFLMGRVIQEDGSYNWHVSGAGRFFLDNILIVK